MWIGLAIHYSHILNVRNKLRHGFIAERVLNRDALRLGGSERADLCERVRIASGRLIEGDVLKIVAAGVWVGHAAISGLEVVHCGSYSPYERGERARKGLGEIV